MFVLHFNPLVFPVQSESTEHALHYFVVVSSSSNKIKNILPQKGYSEAKSQSVFNAQVHYPAVVPVVEPRINFLI